MPYIEYEIQGYYCNYWECVCSEDTRKEAKQTLKEYRENELGTAFKIVKRRVRV